MEEQSAPAFNPESRYMKREMQTDGYKTHVLRRLRKIWSSDFIIPLISVFAIASVYYYELGHFVALGIPTDFLKVELLNKVDLIFTFLMTSFLFLILALAIRLIYHDYLDYNDRGSKFISITFILITLGLGIYILYTLQIFDMELLAPLSLVCLLGFIILNPLRKSFYTFYRIDKILTPFKPVITITIISSFGLVLMYGSGKDKARLNMYSIYRDQRTVLLRQYEGMAIKGLLDSNKKITHFIVTSDISTDTILNKLYWRTPE